jgi:hypothetical protein
VDGPVRSTLARFPDIDCLPRLADAHTTPSTEFILRPPWTWKGGRAEECIVAVETSIAKVVGREAADAEPARTMGM